MAAIRLDTGQPGPIPTAKSANCIDEPQHHTHYRRKYGELRPYFRTLLDDRMRLNNWSIAASYDTARIFVGLGFGPTTATMPHFAEDSGHNCDM